MRSRQGPKQNSGSTQTGNQQIHKVLHTTLFKSVQNAPKKTSFVLSEKQCMRNIMEQIDRDNPAIMQSEEKFLSEMAKWFRGFVSKTNVNTNT